MMKVEEIKLSQEELNWWLERRDTYKVLSEGAKEYFLQVKKALDEKIDRDILEVLDVN